MSEPKKKWSYLMTQYFKNKITPSELVELNEQRADSPMKDSQFRRVTSLPYLIETLIRLDNFDIKASWKEIVARANAAKKSDND